MKFFKLDFDNLLSRADTYQHACGFFLLTKVALEFNIDVLAIFLMLSGFGFFFECLQLTDIYDKFCNWWDSTRLINIIPLGSKATKISVKDIVMNVVGIFSAVIW